MVMNLKLLLIVLLLFTRNNVFGQQKIAGSFILTSDLSLLEKRPQKVLIKKTGLGGFDRTVDTVFITGETLNYTSQLDEPKFLDITFYWPGNKLSNLEFLAIPSSYTLLLHKDLKPVLVNPEQSVLGTRIKELLKETADYRSRSDSLARGVSYEGKTVAAAESQIDLIRDSMELAMDENLYEKYIAEYADSPFGLYALCKYAARPLGNDRIKAAPEKIESLLKQLGPQIAALPSAKILLEKLSLGREMAIGKPIKDLALPDTIGRDFKISDFKGKYLLIDFWASWCAPCRAEHPLLRKAYQQYKDSGFQIMSISRDHIDAKGAWLQAIEQDQTGLWPQLSDFKNLAQKAYDIKYLPTNYLVNPTGKIIAKDLRGAALEKQLQHIFGK